MCFFGSSENKFGFQKAGAAMQFTLSAKQLKLEMCGKA